jgi:tetratricopeptide (TPR) repeat protein
MMRLAALAMSALVALGPAQAGQDDPRLPAMFDRLLGELEQADAERLESDIWRIWYQHDDGQVNTLMSQGRLAMSIGDFAEAEAFYTQVIELDPRFAEGWNRRATLYYLMGHYEDSIADVTETLALEPHHFGALSGMGLIYIALEDEKTALVWFEKALEVNPHMAGVRYRAELIKKRLAGEPT